MKTSTTEKTETTTEFYTRMAKESAEHAARLREMYINRKGKETPLADALWAGHTALREKSEDYAMKAERSKVDA